VWWLSPTLQNVFQSNLGGNRFPQGISRCRSMNKIGLLCGHVNTISWFQSTPPRGGRQYMKKNQHYQLVVAKIPRTLFSCPSRATGLPVPLRNLFDFQRAATPANLPEKSCALNVRACLFTRSEAPPGHKPTSRRHALPCPSSSLPGSRTSGCPARGRLLLSASPEKRPTGQGLQGIRKPNTEPSARSSCRSWPFF
jgi:hypothetical protein